MERLFPAFGAIYAVVYSVVLYQDLPLVSYHPRLGIWEWGHAASINGPVMYWYGLALMSLVVSLPLTAVLFFVPELDQPPGLARLRLAAAARRHGLLHLAAVPLLYQVEDRHTPSEDRVAVWRHGGVAGAQGAMTGDARRTAITDRVAGDRTGVAMSAHVTVLHHDLAATPRTSSAAIVAA